MNVYTISQADVTYIQGKAPAKIDISVLIIFFNRPEKIRAVFEEVRKARPSKLYLYQDGARVGRSDDIESVEKCREIVSNVDWNCEVHRLYQKENFGCDPSEFIAQKWMFSNEEMGIVLEDDDVPAQSLFPFFKELLIRYADDPRIAIICGMNNYDMEESVNDSYFFSKRGSIWGWASWKRFVDMWDGDYAWTYNQEAINRIKDYCGCHIDFETYFRGACNHRDSGKEHYESIMFAAAAQNNMLNIVPKYNMISNIGIDKETTHAVADIRLVPRRNQKLMYKKVYEIEFPLVHPQIVEQNTDYDKKYTVSKFGRFCDLVEIAFRRLIWGR